MSNDQGKTTISDDEIETTRLSGRRGFIGMMAVGGAAGLVPRFAEAQSGDGDNGNWVDGAGCPRGRGGGSTGLTDADSGSITDSGGRGRGAPRC